MRLHGVDLFSGIGGFALGLERAGIDPVAFCEMSPKCRHLLAHHWPRVPCYDDVCTLTAERLSADGIGPVDAIWGGFPCQDISFAGAGAGLEGARSGLWSEFARLIRELAPLGLRYVIVENVAALLGRGLGTVLRDLAACGFDAEWDCIPASAIGAPHRRDRLWIVAYARGVEHQGFGNAFRRALAAQLHGAALADADRCDGGRLDSDVDCGRREASGERSAQATVHDNGGQILAGARHGGKQPWAASDGASWWLTEPDVGRVAHGIPARVDRLHGLGNAVVPQIPENLGRAILEARAA